MKTIFELTSVLIASLIAMAFLRVSFNHKLRKAQEALAQSQESLALTLRSSKIALWYWEIAPNIVSADENCSMVFGLPWDSSHERSRDLQSWCTRMIARAFIRR